MTDRDLAGAYQRGVQGGDPGECPEPDALRQVIEGRTSEVERLAIINHVMACESCRREFDLLDALHQAGASSGRPQTVSRWAMPVAAAAVALIVTMTLWRPWTDPEGPVFRGDATQVQLITEEQAFAPGTVRLVWHAVPDAVQYELRITTSDGDLVANRQGGDTTAMFEGAWTAESGGYRWRVAARRPDGTAVQSAIGRFRIE